MIEEITVTATRRELSLQDTPINITAVTTATLQSRRINDLRGLSAYTPGLTVLDQGPGSVGSVVMRGLSATSTTSSGSNRESSAAIYLGEVPLYLDVKLLDIERVEVLLGPQGTLYGAGTLVGAVRYIPNRPQLDRWEGSAHVRSYALAHSDDVGYEGDVAINVPLIDGTLALRSVAGYYRVPGFIDSPLLVNTPGVSLPQPDFNDPQQVAANLHRGRDLNEERTFSTRNTLLFQPSEDLQAYLTYVYQDTRSGGDQVNGVGVLGTGKYESPARIEEPADRETHMVGLEINANVGEFAQLVSSTGSSRQTIDQNYDISDFLLDLDYGYELFPSFTAIGSDHTTADQLTQELRLVSTGDSRLSWVVGGFYNKLETDSTHFEYLPGFPGWAGIDRPDNLEYAQFVRTETVEKAAFGEATYHLTDAWQVTGGGRFFKYDAEVTGGTALPFFQPYPNVDYNISSGSADDDGFVYKLNTSYKFDRPVLVYATLSEGYRIGGVNRIPACQIPLPPGQNICGLPNELTFGPDETLNKEIGVRATLADRVQVNLALFHMDWDGVQITTKTVNGDIFITANAGEATSSGVEGSFTARLTPRLTLSGTYSYNDVHLTRDAPFLVNGRFDAFDGDRLPGTPKNSGSATAVFAQPLSGGAELEASWSATYRGGIYTHVGLRAFGEEMPGYWLHRASISYRKNQWEAVLFANNIFDKYAVSAIGQDYSKVGVNDGVVSRFYDKAVIQPRVIGLEARFSF